MLSQDVRLSVRLFVTRRYSVETAKHITNLFNRRVATRTILRSYSVPNVMAVLQRWPPPPNGGVECRRSMKKNRTFRPISRFVTEMIQDRAIVTMADWVQVICDLSNGAIFNDLERPLTQISRSRHYLTLNLSETVQDTYIVTTEY